MYTDGVVVDDDRVNGLEKLIETKNNLKWVSTLIRPGPEAYRTFTLPFNALFVQKLGILVVCENNSGQFANYLRMNYQEFNYYQYNKVQGLPFTVPELKDQFVKLLDEK